jgi:hypothetical protein
LNYIKYQLYISWIYRSTTVEGIDVGAGYVILLLLSSRLSDSFSGAEAILSVIEAPSSWMYKYRKA